MPQPLAYLNGRMVPFAAAALPLHDAGFAVGATVVDNARTYGRKLFRWADHLARFRRDCGACFVPLPATDAQLTAAAEELVAHNVALLPPRGELQLATFATPGPLGFYAGAADGPPTLGMATYPVPAERNRRFFAEGISLVAVGHQPSDGSAVLPPTVKHRSRMSWWVADRLARRPPHPPGAVALLTDGPGGTITETSVANFLCAIGPTLVLPPADKVLEGISLRATCELADIPIRREPIPLTRVAEMEEAMLTGTGFGIAGVRRIDGIELPWPGPVFRRLLAAWSAAVGMDIASADGG